MSEKIGRRKFIKTSGVVATISSAKGLGTASAEEMEVMETKNRLVGISIEYKGDIDPQRHFIRTLCGGRPHIIEEESGIATLVSTPLEVFETDDTLVFTGRRYYDPESEIGNGTMISEVPVRSSDYGFINTTAMLADDYESPKIRIQDEENTVTINYEDETVELPDGKKTKRRLAEREMSLKTRKGADEITLKPEIRIKNFGELRIYGKENAQIYPVKRDDEQIKNKLQSVKSASEEEDRNVVNTDESTELLVREVS